MKMKMMANTLHEIERNDPELAVINGASKPSQLLNNVKACEVEIDEESMKEIETILGFTRFERHVG